MKNKTKIITSLLGVSAFMALAVMGGLAKGQKQHFTPAKAEEPEVLYSEDFSGDTMPEGWNAMFDLQDGKAVNNAKATWASVPIPSSAFVESNNYDISFDLHYNAGEDSYFHLVHLDGSAVDQNIYLALVAGGSYWRLANFGECDIYDNSGDDQGCNYVLPEILTKMKEQSIKVRFLILGDVIEVYAEGRRLIAVPMAAFGNNRYSSRRALVKGIMDGFGIDCRGAAGAMTIDNFVMKEAKYGDSYFFHEAEVTDGTYFLPLTYENLYHNSFTMEADFLVHRALVENGENHGYPRFGLIMNQIIPATTLSEPTNAINAQQYLDREFQTAWVGGISPTTGNWSGAGAAGPTQGDYNNDVRYHQTVSVIGDRILFKTVANKEGDMQTQAFETSFTALGLTKGKLLTALVGNHFTNVSNIEFFGYEGNYGIRVAAQNNRYFVGQNVVADAKVYGDAAGAEGVWYLDGVATAETGLHYENGSLAAGKHTLAYGNDSVKSEAFEFEIFENMITIEADKTEMFPIDSATFTATVEGAVASADVRWKVNDEQVQDAEGDQLVLEGLQPGKYTVKAFAGTVVSNEVELTVKQPSLKIAANKGAFAKTETAEITATALGIAGTDTIEWYADGQKLADKTGASLELPLAAYEQAGQVEVQAKTLSEIESNTITLYIYKDVYAEISADPNWKQAYKQEIEAGSTFGAYSAVENADGNYYAPQNVGGGNDAQFPAIAIETQSWSMEYDLLIPESVKSYGGEYYVYPQALGMDSKNPSDWIELALGVGASQIRTYVKTHAAGVVYEYADFNTGKDLSYDGEIVNIGWNHIVYAMQGNIATFYVNGELVFYANIPNSTVPSGFIMSMYPGNGGEIPLGFKNFTVKGIVVPPPAITAVSVNASKVSVKVGESVTLSATVNPYNATYETIEWYVNGQKVEGANALTFTLTASEAGEYSVVCKIDGISSAAKVITVTADAEPDPEPEPEPAKKGCGGSIVAASALISITALAGFGLLLSKKRKER